MKKTNLNISDDMAQQLVDGVANGFNNFLSMLKREVPNLAVSGGLAWAKGDYIDTGIKNEIEDTNSVKISKQRAGSWPYLSFELPSLKTKKPNLLIVRNARTLKETVNGNPQEMPSYLKKDAAINNPLFESGKIKTRPLPQAIQLELLPSEAYSPKINSASEENNQFSQEYDCFYILTYEIDQNQMIKSIKLTMPNEKTSSLVTIKDLSEMLKGAPKINNADLPNNIDIPEAQYDNQKYSVEEINTQSQKRKE